MAKKKSSRAHSLFTYRAGKKLKLVKRSDQFVVRRLPEDLLFENALSVEQTSSASTRVTCDPSDLESMMSEARGSSPAHHAYEDADSKKPFLITDRIMARFVDDVDEMGVAKFAGDYGLEILDKLSEREYLFRLTDETGMNPVKLIVKLTEKDDRLEMVDHDLNQVINTRQLIPTDPQYTAQWHLHQRRTPSSEYDPRSSANVEGAWRLLDNHGSADVVIGVADDGCQLDHDDFDSANKFAGWGYFEGTTLKQRGDIGADADRMYEDGANHGTACCGVIGAEVDGEMTVGAAADCQLVPVKWESSGSSLFISDSKLLTALRYMDSRVDVISNSWGSSPSSSWSSIVLSTINQMAQSGGRRGNGVVFLWAAGNESCPISHSGNVDVPFTDGWEPVRNRFGQIIGWRWVGVETSRVFSDDLALLDSVLSVAALSSTAQRSHYSCYGTGIDITAPSSNSHAYFRIDLPGLGIVTTKGRDTIRNNFGGTSSATPLVAAVAALVISANDALSAAEVIHVLKQTASKDLNMTDWPKTPPASFDLDTSWDVSPVAPFDAGDFSDIGSADGTWSPWFGHGKVDARAAVARALELRGDQSSGLSVSRAVNQVIPDDNPIGVRSSINVTERGRIASIAVNVSITHTWRGDLRVALLGPGGERVVLHDRQGGSGDDLVRSFETDDVPGLSIFLGTEVHGAWTLEVVDQAGADIGTLNEWGIDFEIQRSNELRYESRPAAQIPDNDPAGIIDAVEVAENQTVADIAVEVDITHSWKGDLRVSISAPNGDTVMLHNRTGQQEDNIRETYSVATRPELVNFVGANSRGEWALRVSDHAGLDVGKLNAWALLIR